jgi:hypothetical protein
VHSERGRERSPGWRRRHRHPAPVFPSDPEQRDDGHTVLCFGVIRPYKGLADAIEAVGGWATPGCSSQVMLEPMGRTAEAARGLDVEWRLGYLPKAEVDRALGEATVAVFPTAGAGSEWRAAARARRGRARGRLRRGGVAEPIRAFGAGRVVPAATSRDSPSCARALSDGDALEQACGRAARAGGADVGRSARAHLTLYGELT